MFKESEESFGGKPAATHTGKTLTMKTVKWAKANDEGGKFVDRKLMPLKTAAQQNQFAPTDAEPVRMRYKLGGGC